MSLSKIKGLLTKVYNCGLPSEDDLAYLLGVDDRQGLACIFDFDDNVRKCFAGEGILLRGIIEFSNHCFRQCFYCGLNAGNLKLARYRLSQEEILASVKTLAQSGIKTVVLQSGEDKEVTSAWISQLIRRIKADFDIAVTLSLGERTQGEYEKWFACGADRYLLKIETSDKKLYSSIHRRMNFNNRLKCLKILRRLGYQVGSGSIIGIPGQGLRHIARDIIFFKSEGFDMLGIGPFIPASNTEFADKQAADVRLVLKTLALTRIVTKNTHLPATTALGSLGRDYRPEGLKAGANVLMPNFTPLAYRKLYSIYPGKRCLTELPGTCNHCMERMAASVGRSIDYARGDSLKHKERGINVQDASK